MSIPYVSYCDDDIKIKDAHGDLVGQLLKLGAQKGLSDGELSFQIERDEDRIALFAQLRDMGLAFARGREWSPAEQFEELRDKGRLVGLFKCIEWRGPSDPNIKEM